MTSIASELKSELVGEEGVSTGSVELVIAYTIRLVALVAAAAFAVHQAYNSFAASLTFLEPLGGYWECTLAVLGAVTVGLVIRNFGLVNGESKKDKVSLPVQFLIIGVLAWAVTELFL